MDSIEELLSLFDLEEVFEQLDITPREVIEHLLEHGLVVLPPYLEKEDVGEEQEPS